MNELILLCCYSGAIGAVGGFLLCIELTRWHERKLERQRLAIKRKAPFEVLLFKLARGMSRIYFRDYKKPDNPPQGAEKK